ncbi:hypothetical protein, partial [Citrobacter sp. S-77]|uniref:hypothetical protein n=1 Tax=Citrobacter sp. S-77 TaxID=1080067 RepID=UPI001CBB36AB
MAAQQTGSGRNRAYFGKLDRAGVIAAIGGTFRFQVYNREYFGGWRNASPPYNEHEGAVMTKHYDYIAIGGGSGGIASINRAAMYGQK